MRNIKNYKSGGHNSGEGRRIGKHYYKIIVFILAATLISACTSTLQSSSPATEVPPTPTILPAVPSSSPPTAIPTTLSNTATNLSPTMTEPPAEEAETDQDNSNVMETNIMYIQIGDTVLTATLAENTSVDTLKAALLEGPITISMSDYGSMEKVGPLGMDLPRNDEQITTQAGDIILYQGNMLVIYYAPNSWNFTRLGKINDVTADELREILGDGNVTVTLSLP